MDEKLTHPRIRVALVDDQQLFRSGLAVIIGAQPDMEVIAQAADGTEALAQICTHGPDVVLMDVQMSPMDGVEATRRIFGDGEVNLGARPKVIMLTTFDWDEHAATAIRHGASGFILKDSTPEFVCESIRAVHGGSAVIAPQSLAALLRDEPVSTPELPGQYLELTEREREVFNAVALGLTNQEISSKLFLSESTVKTHIGAILRKLSLRDRVQIVVYSYENCIGR
ncbi:response regulator transcription factor [Paeniglutamicibacter gangotriensis]|uniref:Response regulator transcription factor n=1 Tax=Paeniglutamicibacter gangotriensis TaxID=254787 RepID=A0A5B0EIJ2_9MICC|nr:response regulator transcription factor [Paeniglutamicibacter gangotriensis]KAA0978733.1 response regulator transcription factor [Paeniglutamicibacter gangotriensis]